MAGEAKHLRPASEKDLPRIAEIHLQAYSRSHFTSRLPTEVLQRYYRLFLSDGAETLLMVETDESGSETVLGFAVFGRGIGDKIARFKRDNFGAILAASLRNPVAAAGKAIGKLWNTATLAKAMLCADHLLLSVAVARPGTGVGRTLLDAFLSRSAAQGAKRAGLYVNADNLVAINAYVSLGFVFRELHGGQYYMERALDDRPANRAIV